MGFDEANQETCERLRLEVQRLEARQISEMEWGAAYGHAISSVSYQDEDLVIEEAREYLRAKWDGRRPKSQRTQVRDRGADPRFAALADVIAEEASRDPEVRWWRDIYLGTRLLEPREIHAYFENAQRTAPPLQRVTVWATATDGREYTGDGRTVTVHGHLGEVHAGRLPPTPTRPGTNTTSMSTARPSPNL